LEYPNNIIACDIDNTVANQEERFLRNFDTNRNILKSDAFSRYEMLLDKPIRDSVDVINVLGKKYNIIWVSARKKSWHNRSVEWLKKHNFPFDKIHLVEQNDNKIKVLVELKPIVFIDDMKYNWENFDPKPCTNFMSTLDSLNIPFEIFNDNWRYIEKKYG